MRALSLPVMALLAMALLSGCGQKGPLYFASQPAAKTAPAKQSTQDKPTAPEQQQKQEQGTDHQHQNSDGN